MAMPIRIQRKRTKGWRMPPNTIYVGRPTKWGNPYRIGDIDGVTGNIITPELAVTLFSLMWRQSAWSPIIDNILLDLRGHNLACWCPLKDEHGNHVPCHADTLLEMANR